MAISLDNVFGIHEEALKLRARRVEILANNIANVDTPGFKARDINFSEALKDAMSGQSSSALKVTHENHIAIQQPEGEENILYRQPHQSSLDGNTVEGYVEQANFAKNAIEYQASLKFLEGRINGIMKAIKGE